VTVGGSSVGTSGFSLVEVMMVVILLAILSVSGVALLIPMLSDQKLVKYGTQMEYMIKYAKLHAMEKTVKVGICVSGNQLTLYDLGTVRDSTVCGTSGQKIMAMTVEAGDVSSGITLTGSSVSVDPRGLALYPGTGGNGCVSNGRKYYKTTVGVAGVRTQQGTVQPNTTGCPS
jgi:prepilin-type N-terminal cleavage/methylation domain-containing protein